MAIVNTYVAKDELPALGTAGQILTVNSGATGVEWASPSGGFETFTSVTVSTWVSDNTYADYPYRASVALTGVTSSDFAEVTFSAADAISGYYAPVCETYSGGVYLYSTTDDSITVPTIVVFKG